MFIDWFQNSGEFKHGKKPEEVGGKLLQWIKNQYQLGEQHKDRMILSLAFTHSWIIDAAVVFAFPEFRDNYPQILNTADFIKYENGSLYYNGKWS